MEILKYQIEKMQTVKGVNRIVNEVKKIDGVFNATIDKETKILVIECPEINDEIVKNIEEKSLKAIRIFEKQARLERIDNKQIYRRVLYLNGLDCAYCGTRIENYAKKEFNHQRIVVDYPTYRFIIETSDKNLIDNILDRVTNIAHKVDERIVVTMASKDRPKVSTLEKKAKAPSTIVIYIGLLIFIIGSILAYDFDEIVTGHANAKNIVGVILVVIGYVLIGHKIILRFLKNLIKGRIFDENFLMTVASIGALITQNYVEAVIVMILYQLGEFLQNVAVNKTRKSITDLLSYEVQNVKIKIGDEITEIGVEGVLPDDVIVVGPGEFVPLDGRISKGSTFLDTKNITGESRGREVKVGDEILSGSVNIGNMIEVRVTRAYSNSMMTRILDLVENATINKAKSETFISKFAKYYTPCVVAIGALICFIGILVSIITHTDAWNKYVYTAMEFLVISCPCALVISVPLCFFSAIGVAGKRGILVKGSNYLEAMYNLENIVFDKTGTITKGNFTVTSVHPVEGYTEEALMRYLVYAEYYSPHPIGISIVEKYGKENVFTEIISEPQSLQGGVRAVINGSNILVASAALATKEKCTFPLIESPNLIAYIFKEKKYIGYAVIGDEIREEAFDTIASLRRLEVSKIYMLTGDTKGIAESVANTLQIDEVYSELLPDQKVALMDQIKDSCHRKNGTTAFVGDGINDAPVIATSDVGIAMGDTASDATISIADIVIMTNDLNKLNELLLISKKTRNRIIENISFCLAVKFIVMILAVFCANLFTLPLWFAIFSDVGVSLLTILNSFTLLNIFGKKNTKGKVSNGK